MIQFKDNDILIVVDEFIDEYHQDLKMGSVVKFRKFEIGSYMFLFGVYKTNDELITAIGEEDFKKFELLSHNRQNKINKLLKHETN